MAMNVLVTAGPTREYIDPVRFITNGSSGRMGYAVAAAAAAAGHEVTLLTGPVALTPPAGCQVVRFVSVEDLQQAMGERFDACDVLVMTAAVGDFRPDKVSPAKLSRSCGPLTLRLIPTEDVLAGFRERKRRGQIVVGFAVEDGTPPQMEAKARSEMAAKGSDFTVVNTPAAMGARESSACILSPRKVLLPWGVRTKDELAGEIVAIVGSR